MNADITWLDNPQIFRINQLPAHSDHVFYANKEELALQKSSFYQSLNGTWQFHYSKNPSFCPTSFYKEGFDSSFFQPIAVPGHIELAGYDSIHYINTLYPWDGHDCKRPGDRFSDATYNPVGSYLKTFDLEDSLLHKRVFVCFEGVEQAMYLWLNGHFIGYAEDSFTPSEFELTPYLLEKGNVLAVQVYKRCSAAFLEDQDFFRFFGIFRNVTLYATPMIHVEDLWAQPTLLPDNTSGTFALSLRLSTLITTGTIHVTLSNQEGTCILSETLVATSECSLPPTRLERVIPWDHKHPYLYQLLLDVRDSLGNTLELIPYQIGFRRIEIKQNVILLNGKRLILNGVNRHEWNAKSGRCININDMKSDIAIFLANHINAVRTSHYPNQIPWYFLCDENGIYMMAETNLESHGSWQKLGAVEPSWNVPGSIPAWKEVVLDRAKTNFETFKNHTSILFWSLGNESYAGDNLASMNTYFKTKDPSRLVHYEGVFHNRSYDATISDVESRMYATPQEIIDYLSNHPKKPYLLCEYMHDMGNSLGGMSSYMDLLKRFPSYHGGFIWDYIDQALLVQDEVTKHWVLRYGGDFDDRPSDYEFSGNGIVFANRSEKPAMQEVNYYYGLYQ